MPNSHVSDATEALRNLTPSIDETVSLVDQLPDLCRAFSLDEHASVAVALKAARDAVSKLKARLTAAQIACDEWFCRRIAETGETLYRAKTGEVAYTFSASARGFFTGPSQSKSPAEHAALLKWLQENGYGARVDITVDGRVTIDGFDELCDEVLEAGKSLPESVKAHIVASVRMTKRV